MSKLGEEIIEGLEEALSFVEKRGRKAQRVTQDRVSIKGVSVYTPAHIKKFRHKLGMSTSVFANLLGASQRTVTLWEKGERKPNATAMRLLSTFEKHPEVLLDYIVKK
jgi:DNA-binding transcriptional regulator YiaG